MPIDPAAPGDPASQPLLLLTAPDESRPFDAWLDQALLTEGYHLRRHRAADAGITTADLAGHALVIISAGAAARIDCGAVEGYLTAGGRAVIVQPPREWGPLFGLRPRTETYATVADGYLQVNAQHRWLAGFPTLDLQCPGEAHIYESEAAEPLAFIAGQLGCPTPFPAIALSRVGAGLAVVLTWDLADCLVTLQQGRIANASNGPNPDADRNGKFTAEDLFVGLRDWRLREVPQADVLRDLLVRIIVALTGDLMPLPRLWHFPHAAPALALLDGDGDGMDRADLLWTAETCERHGARFSFYLMQEQIEAFSAAEVGELRRRGHGFGPHPWVCIKPSISQWRAEIGRITAGFREKLGFAPTCLRAHSVIFPGWDETPRILADHGLRLDTSFINGYLCREGYLNGSALPVRFIGRDGRLINCREQSTIHGDDTLWSTKCMLPSYSEAERMELSLRLMRELAEVHHGVYHPYFHPICLGARGSINTADWFQSVLRAAGDLGLPMPSADDWLAFNDARDAVAIGQVRWDSSRATLSFALRAPAAIAGLTVLLPPYMQRAPRRATVDAEPVDLRPVGFERLGWTALVLDLAAGDAALSASYPPAT